MCLLLHLLLAKQCADALVGSRWWSLVFLLLLLWLVRRVVASLPTCPPCSFSSLPTLVCLPCFLLTLCACVCCVVGRQLSIICCLSRTRIKKQNSTASNRRLHMQPFFVRALERVRASSPGEFTSTVHVESTLLVLSILLAILLRRYHV
jgi:hypothetical protein